MRPRRCAVENQNEARHLIEDSFASMRPRRMLPWRTNAIAEAYQEATRCFNAATANVAVENPTWQARWRRCRDVLQCGHGELPWRTVSSGVLDLLRDAASMRPRRWAVENATSTISSPRAFEASMRPRRWAVENIVRRPWPIAGGVWLQCGHGDGPWRTGPRERSKQSRPSRFNAATAMSRGER